MKKIDSFEDWVIALDRSIANAHDRHNKIVELIHTMPPQKLREEQLPGEYFDLGAEGQERYSTQVVCGRIIERYRRKEYFYTTPKGAIDLVKRVEAVVHGRPYVSEEEDQEFIQKMFSLGSWTPKEKRDLLEMKVSDFGKKDRVEEGENFKTGQGIVKD